MIGILELLIFFKFLSLHFNLPSVSNFECSNSDCANSCSCNLITEYFKTYHFKSQYDSQSPDIMFAFTAV
jgi:hypothetical protein